MAIAHVQTVFATNATVSTISATLTTTAGNGVVVHLMFSDTSASVGAITQTAGDTLGTAKVTISDSTAGYTVQYANYNVAGGSTTFTFTTVATHSVCLFVTEISGQATTAAFDQSSTLSGTIATTHAIGATPTLSQANEIVIAAFNGDGSGTTGNISLNNGFTIPTNGNQMGAGITGIRGLVAYLVVAATTGIGCTMTSDNVIANGVIGTYEAAAAIPVTNTLWAQSLL